jgi:hypothetical protein
MSRGRSAAAAGHQPNPAALLMMRRALSGAASALQAM